MKKILFVASECVPFIKTGGLADVCGALPKWFGKEEWDVRVVLPNYACIPERFRGEFRYLTHFYMDLGPDIQNKYVGVLSCELDGIIFYFIDNQEYFSGSSPYGETRSDIEKFCFFDKAVLSMLPLVGFQPNLIHCHDWETGMIPVFLNNEFQGDMFFWHMKSVMTIHNLKFQGIWDIKTIRNLTGLPGCLFTPDKLEYRKDANMLKAGLVYADYITTVSPTYTTEIQTHYYGEGLEGLLSARKCDMQGILNGIDYKVYDPETDSDIPKNYGIASFRRDKVKNKILLQRELGLEEDPKKFMVGLVSRLTDQKGIDLVLGAMDRIADECTQFVIVGTGERRYEESFLYFADKYKTRVSANICYDDNLVRRLFASADAFLMPSRFEPCGLTQMIASRYGTVPIVRETGGLCDTVEAYNEYENTGNGFSFLNYNPDDMLTVINYARHIYFNRKRQWNLIVERGMQKDFSWQVSAEKYKMLYHGLIG